MAFGVAQHLTNIGSAIFADRVKTTPATYTTPPKYLAVGTGAETAARTAAVTDTALSTEVERTTGTESIVTTAVTGDTYEVVATVKPTVNRALNEAGLFDTLTASSGHMFTSATFAVINLVGNQDELTLTWKTEIQAV